MKHLFITLLLLSGIFSCSTDVFKGINIAKQVAAKNGISAVASDHFNNGERYLNLEYKLLPGKDNFFYNKVLLETHQELKKNKLNYSGLRLKLEDDKEGVLTSQSAELILKMKAVCDQFNALLSQKDKSNAIALLNPGMITEEDFELFWKMIVERYVEEEFTGFSLANLNSGNEGFVLMYQISKKHRLQFNFESKETDKPLIFGLFLPDYSPVEID